MHLRSSARRRKREARSLALGERLDRPTGIPEPVHEVRSAVANLSARQRAVLYLTYWEDLDERTTAHRLGISVGSVRRHLDRARKNVEGKLHDSL
jgi:RNA polymerase sigma factor (sigma-70 family)